MAQINPNSSRPTAVTTCCEHLLRPSSLRYRHAGGTAPSRDTVHVFTQRRLAFVRGDSRIRLKPWHPVLPLVRRERESTAIGHGDLWQALGVHDLIFSNQAVLV